VAERPFLGRLPPPVFRLTVFVYGPEAPREIVQIPVAAIYAVVDRLVFEKVALERIVIERAIH
jgi:hypothetical protein